MNTRHQPDTPKVSQIAIGIGIAFLNAKAHVETAALLVQNKKHKPAYSEWSHGIEEIGKALFYWRCLGGEDDKRQAAWDKHLELLESHEEKIRVVSDTLDYLLRLESEHFSLKITIDSTDPAYSPKIRTFLEFLVKTHGDGRLHQWLVSLRESVTYTSINDGRVASPEKVFSKIPDGLLEVVIGLTANSLNAVDMLFAEALGPAYKQLQEHYVAGKPYDRTTYADLERTLNRVLPALTEIARHSLSQNISIKNNPEYVDLIKKVGKETGTAKIIAMVWAIKKTFELAASDQILSGQAAQP